MGLRLTYLAYLETAALLGGRIERHSMKATDKIRRAQVLRAYKRVMIGRTYRVPVNFGAVAAGASSQQQQRS
jgi:hypothetical protein